VGVLRGLLGFTLTVGSADLGPDIIEGEPEHLRDGRYRRESRGCDAARLDLAQGLGGDPRVEGDFEHGAGSARATEHGAETLSALDLRGTKRQPDHGPSLYRDNMAGIVIGFTEKGPA
jgi:hypothetical protein